jgi:hypothetical protein
MTRKISLKRNILPNMFGQLLLNEPVVCRPEEALDCLLRTRMDMLVLGDWMIVREGADG